MSYSTPKDDAELTSFLIFFGGLLSTSPSSGVLRFAAPALVVGGWVGIIGCSTPPPKERPKNFIRVLSCFEVKIATR